jgi:hypothetical protein
VKIEKRKFDAVLDKLIAAPPEKRAEVKPDRKPRKARKSSARGARKA